MHTYPLLYFFLSYFCFFLTFLNKIIQHTMGGWMRRNEQAQPSLMELLQQYEQKHQRMRKLVLAQEVKQRLTNWSGGYRWFESENVVCLEKVRRVRAKQAGA